MQVIPLTVAPLSQTSMINSDLILNLKASNIAISCMNE